MELNKTIIILITIIGMVVAAAAVCATTVHATEDLGYGDDGTLAVDQDTIDDSLQLNSGADDLNATNTTSTNMTNSTGHAAGSDINATGLVPLNATNSTGHAAGGVHTNVTNSTGHAAGGSHANATSTETPHKMLSTGNPILVLLAVMSVIGVYSIKRK